jgi:hypothetical protein
VSYRFAQVQDRLAAPVVASLAAVDERTDLVALISGERRRHQNRSQAIGQLFLAPRKNKNVLTSVPSPFEGTPLRQRRQARLASSALSSFPVGVEDHRDAEQDPDDAGYDATDPLHPGLADGCVVLVL